MNKRKIKKVAVLGSGVMGSRIACHFANVGLEVLLLDIVPKELTDPEKAKNLLIDNKLVKNRIVNDALQSALKSHPSPIYKKSFVKRITTGNFSDDFEKIATCDWIIEVVVERLDIKKLIFDKVEKFRKPGTLISSNTSGIPIHLMTQGRNEDFQKHFCGTHFFNPPRYLKLLEIIPTAQTSQEVIDFFIRFGQKYLGKTTVLAKDTPAFIANRVGIFIFQSILHKIEQIGFTVEDIDKLTGPIIGRAKSATFRTCDVIGIDVLIHVANGISQNCPNDESKELLAIPDYINFMVANNWLGSKTNQGFYKKVKNEKGESEILSFNLKSRDYQSQVKTKFPALDELKNIDNLAQKIKILYNGNDEIGAFYKDHFLTMFHYVSNRIPEISDDIYKIDDAIKAGFGWEQAPFESWDAIGVQEVVKDLEQIGSKPAQWIYDMIAKGITSFYKVESGKKFYYDISAKDYLEIESQREMILLSNFSEKNIIWKNKGTTIKDIGDGIINLEFHTKMNTIGSEVIQGMHKAIDIAESGYKGLVISNEGANFSAGANVGLIFMMAAEQEYEELNFAIKSFQDAMMRVRYSAIPVVIAPHNLTLGGGCEMCLHADSVVAHAELYMGLVEFGVGVIPGGGGTKEFALRIADSIHEGDIRINALRERFLTIGQAKVSTSAHEAFELGYLREGIDEIVINKDFQLARAKEVALKIASEGYIQPIERKDIRVLGKEGLGIVYVGANTMFSGNFISEHDKLISEKLGYVMCGGDLSEPTEVSEQYLLDLERKAFLELCMKRKTLERLQSIITTGKVLRN
jgi:3-hydroxyacyl-CoA dehydrogenase